MSRKYNLDKQLDCQNFTTWLELLPGGGLVGKHYWEKGRVEVEEGSKEAEKEEPQNLPAISLPWTRAVA